MPDYPFAIGLVCILSFPCMNNSKEQQDQEKNQRQHTDIFSLLIMMGKRNDNDPIIRSCCRSSYQCIYHEERVAGDHI